MTASVLCNTGQLRPSPTFMQAYGDLFKHSLGEVPVKDELVYKNMLRLSCRPCEEREMTL